MRFPPPGGDGFHILTLVPYRGSHCAHIPAHTTVCRATMDRPGVPHPNSMKKHLGFIHTNIDTRQLNQTPYITKHNKMNTTHTCNENQKTKPQLI